MQPIRKCNQSGNTFIIVSPYLRGRHIMPKYTPNSLDNTRQGAPFPPGHVPETQTITVTPTKSSAGRPTTVLPTPEITAEICERIARDESLVSICESPHLPCRDTIYRWLLNIGENPDLTAFSDAYSRARAAQPEATYERLIQLEYDVLNDRLNPNAARVALLSMQWRMAKNKPKKYGDIKQLDVSGGIDLNITPINKKLDGGKAQIEHKSEGGSKRIGGPK